MDGQQCAGITLHSERSSDGEYARVLGGRCKKPATKGSMFCRYHETEPFVGQCQAKAKQSGQRCRREAVRGARVCYFHGGAAPQVRAAAAERELLLPRGKWRVFKELHGMAKAIVQGESK
jgi:hypothetical protein